MNLRNWDRADTERRANALRGVSYGLEKCSTYEQNDNRMMIFLKVTFIFKLRSLATYVTIARGGSVAPTNN